MRVLAILLLPFFWPAPAVGHRSAIVGMGRHGATHAVRKWASAAVSPTRRRELLHSWSAHSLELEERVVFVGLMDGSGGRLGSPTAVAMLSVSDGVVLWDLACERPESGRVLMKTLLDVAPNATFGFTLHPRWHLQRRLNERAR